MQNLLVTGGAGFIGTNFIYHLFKQNDFTGTVINVDSLTYAANIKNLDTVEKQYPGRYTFKHTCITKFETMLEIINEYNIDTVVHFAAESHVDRSIKYPLSFIQSNVVGTFTLLEACKQAKNPIEKFHHVSTDEVYGSLGKTGQFTESTPYDPSSPYSASKASSDHFVNAYNRTFGLPITISNCSNNYGPYQFPEKLIPLMLQQIMHKKPLPVYGDGSNVRDWLYVDDHCDGIYQILKNGKNGQTYNIGGNCEKSNLEIVNTLCEIMQNELPSDTNYKELITFVDDRPGHDFRYSIDASKIDKELHWKPSETFETGIKKTVQWYLKNQDWMDFVSSGQYRKWYQEHYQL